MSERNEFQPVPREMSEHKEVIARRIFELNIRCERLIADLYESLDGGAADEELQGRLSGIVTDWRETCLDAAGIETDEWQRYWTSLI